MPNTRFVRLNMIPHTMGADFKFNYSDMSSPKLLNSVKYRKIAAITRFKVTTYKGHHF